ncbi:MAG TPA: MurR/RpiR family transcriptional regulator [Candidatus Dormibacteraeota bacterium]|jgi:DNA-binding MurR/RpiR family transcriptional regulator|nr:MurR/RpiR family transcriptional regulator [Candidatus Dormibacteraeota bacterium]
MGEDVTNVTGHETRVAELVRSCLNGLSPAERKLARVLLASYPIAGLESVARFAERAQVSPPTVTRFITKLGFSGYPEFQETLRHEVQARLSSPLTRYRDDQPERGTESLLSDALDVAADNLRATLDVLSHRDVNEAVEIVGDVRRRVMVLGGRVSAPLARYLAAQLHLLRPGIGLVDSERSAPAQQLIDMRKGDVLIVFDYRRYQSDTIESARVAAAQGCNVILFTDPWLSPASAFARQVIVTSVDMVGPFDSLVGAMAVVEGVVAAVLSRLGPRAQSRMQSLERLRAGDVLADTDQPSG